MALAHETAERELQRQELDGIEQGGGKQDGQDGHVEMDDIEIEGGSEV
jgi:hypothetical protein